MELLYRRDRIRDVSYRWAKVYSRFGDDHRFPSGHTVGGIKAALAALDFETCTSEDVAKAIGNTSWADHDCDECGRSFDVLLRLGQTPDYEARWWDVCSACLAEGAALLNSGPSTERPEGTSSPLTRKSKGKEGR